MRRRLTFGRLAHVARQSERNVQRAADGERIFLFTWQALAEALECPPEDLLCDQCRRALGYDDRPDTPA